MKSVTVSSPARRRWAVFCFVAVSFLLLVLSGCNSSELGQTPAPATAGATSTGASQFAPTAVSTNTASAPAYDTQATYTPTAPLAFSETLTPLATLSIDERLEFLRYNNGLTADCRLPCWLSLVPGESTFQMAEQRLASLGAATRSEAMNSARTAWRLSFAIPHPEYVGTYLLAGWLNSRDGVVTDVALQSVWNPAQGDFVQGYLVREIVNALGEPEAVWVVAANNINGAEAVVVVDLYYPEGGVLARFSDDTAEEVGAYTRSCLGTVRSSQIRLFPPGSYTSYEEMMSSTNLASEDLTLISPQSGGEWWSQLAGVLSGANECLLVPARLD